MNKPELKTVYIDTNKSTLEEQLVITFTPEEYNQHIKDIIKETLNNAADEAEVEYDDGGITDSVNKKSITNTLKDTFNTIKI